MKSSKALKRALQLSIIGGFFFMLGFFYKYHLPRIENWILLEAEELTQRHSPIRVWAKEVDLKFFPLGLKFKDIRLQPQESIKHMLHIDHLDELELHLSFWSVIKGHFELGLIRLSGAEIKVFAEVNPDSSNNALKIDFAILDLIPIQNIEIQNIALWLKEKTHSISLHTPRLDLDLQKNRRNLTASLKAQSMMLKRTNEPEVLRSNLDIGIHVTEKEITFNRLRLQKDDSFILASGWLEWNPNNLNVRRVVGRARSHLYLSDVEKLIKELRLSPSPPQLSGNLSLEFKTDHTFGSKQEAEFELRSTKAHFAGYEIGSIETSGLITDKKVNFNNFKLEHSGGSAQLKNLSASLEAPYPVEASVTGTKIDIHKLLAGIKIPGVPVYTDLTPDLNCKAKLKPTPLLNCDGKVLAHQAEVTLENKLSVVKIQNGSVAGTVSIDHNKVKYQAEIKLENSLGQSSGEIVYSEGFNIAYNTDLLDFKDIPQIAGLKTEGVAKIKGTTSGNSDYAHIDMDLEVSDLYLEDFGAGHVLGEAKYRKGSLYFNHVKGDHRSTRYQGNLTLDILNQKLRLDAKVPFLDTENIQELLARRYDLGTKITGTGNASVSLRGPFDVHRLSFDGQAQLFRGTIAGESYDQITGKLESKSGLIEFKQLSLTKGNAILNVLGNMQSGKSVDTRLIGRGFRLEQSETLIDRSLKLNGVVDFDSRFHGPFNRLAFDGTGAIRNVLLGDSPVDGAKFQWSLNDTAFQGQAEFGQKVAQFNWNLGLTPTSPTILEGHFNNWDFSQIFSIISDSHRANNYSSILNGHFNYKNTGPNIEHAEGLMTLDKLHLKTNDIALENQGSMKIKLDRGQIETTNFNLMGTGGVIGLVSTPGRRNNLNLKATGKLNLGLFHILTPFLDDLRGQMILNLALSGPILAPQFSGKARLEDTYARAKAFPHGLEQMDADLLLDRHQIVISTAQGVLAGGKVQGTGQISLENVNQVPVDIRGQFLDASFNVPTGFNTRGNGQFTVRGQWFPYSLTLGYDVTSGKVEREFDGNEAEAKEIRPSIYLPKFLAKKRFSPIELDLSINLPNDFPVKLRVSRLEVDSKVSGSIRVMGPPEEPLLDGRIQIEKGGEIVFRDNIFEVISGFVEYKNQSPDNPRLNITAQSQITATIDADNEEKQFDVLMRVLGSASEPQVTVSSQPPLSETELISLLTLGFVSDKGGDVSDSQSEGEITNTSYQLGSAFLNEQLGINRKIGKRLGVKFDFSSAFDSDDNAAVHTFTVKKQWTPKFGTSASRSVGKTSTNKVEAKYRLNNKVSIIGNYEGTEQTGANDSDDEDEDDNLFGLDIEYKVDFK